MTKPTSTGAEGAVLVPREPTEVDHPYLPAETRRQRVELAKRVSEYGPDAVADILFTYALSQPSQGSFAGSLWAIAEQVKGMATALSAAPDPTGVGRQSQGALRAQERSVPGQLEDGPVVSGQTGLIFDQTGRLEIDADHPDFAWLTIRPSEKCIKALERLEKPYDGSHVLLCDASTPFGNGWTFDQRPPTVGHYWSNPGEEGFYVSVSEGEPQRPLSVTHWRPLPAEPDQQAAQPSDTQAGTETRSVGVNQK